ncbi:MAG: preprotein translocase subunit SecE [Gammaproteobacteria bacterium]|nr:preprotein translocase subunit SecE [Gammaproteobacteria bacterium]
MAVKPKIETHTSPLDVVKLGVAVVLLVFGVGTFYYYGTHPLVYGGEVHEISTTIRLVVMLAAIALAIVAARFSGPGASAWRYLMSSRGELQRVVWPSRQQTIQTTIAVIVMVILLGVFMWVVDLIVKWGLGGITGT